MEIFIDEKGVRVSECTPDFMLYYGTYLIEMAKSHMRKAIKARLKEKKPLAASTAPNK